MFAKHLLLLLPALLLASCATVDKTSPAEYQYSPEQKMPPISFFYKQPGNELSEACDEFKPNNFTRSCVFNHIDAQIYWRELQTADTFAQVALANKDVDYRVMVASLLFSESDAADIGKSALAGATLLLVPVNIEHNAKVEVMVGWRGAVIKRYEYDIPFVSTMSLYHNPASGAQNFAKNVISNFIRDAQEENVFSGEFLAAALDASNYVRDLQAPDHVGPLNLAGRHVYNDPFLGTQLRYQHYRVPTQYIDVFVYPIRRTEWENVGDVLSQEAEHVRKEIDILRLQGEFKKVTFHAETPLSWTHNGALYSGTQLHADIFDKEQEQLRSTTYLFVKKDKIIKFRATTSVLDGYPDMTEYVTRLLPLIDPPEESLFMAKIRQQNR